MQFALHYLAKDLTSWVNFFSNVSSNTKEGGIFFGTCYDGEALFDLLRHRDEGESISAGAEENPIWRLTKAYDKVDFPDSNNSLGYAVDECSGVNRTYDSGVSSKLQVSAYDLVKFRI